MKIRVVAYTFIKSACVLLCGHLVQAFEWPLDTAETQIVKKVLVECLERDTHACFAEKLTRAVDNSVDWDIPIFEGITLKRNNVHINKTKIELNQTTTSESTSRGLSGMDQLYNSVIRFIDAHTLTLDFGEVDNNGSEGGRTIEDIEFRDGGGKRKKIGKKERRRVQYALFVLLGIFGLTAPLILKTLGIMAGKALLSSKVALIMLGSIALKKIFQADNHSPVKVHTHTIPIHEDDHDRYDYGAYNNYYTANKYYTKSPLNLI